MREKITTAYDDIEYIGGNDEKPLRVAVLYELANGGTKYWSDLRRIFVQGDGDWEWTVSATTLTRSLTGDESRDMTGLTEKHWIIDVSSKDSSEGEYRITPLGRYVLDGVLPLCDVLSLSSNLNDDRDLAEFFGLFPFSELNLSREGLLELDDADVVIAEESYTEPAIEMIMAAVDDTQRLNAISPLVVREYLDRIHPLVKDESRSAEVILTSEVLRHLESSENLTDKWEEMIADGLTVFEYEGDLTFSLAILDDKVGLGGHDSSGHLDGTLLSDSANLRQWTEDIYDEYRMKSTEYDLSQ